MSTVNKLVLASANPGKIKELRQMLDQLGIEVIPQTELSIPDIEETGLCFVENSILKARNASALSGLPAIADDSGLEVDYLKGAPGIYSARFAGADATDAAIGKNFWICSLRCQPNSAPPAIKPLWSICATPVIPRQLFARVPGRALLPLMKKVMAVLATTLSLMCQKLDAVRQNWIKTAKIV